MNYTKYPRTYHLPWSCGCTNDDKKLRDTFSFNTMDEVVVTEKMDGENTTLYRDYIHARSLDSQAHWSQSYVRRLQAEIGYKIPEKWRVCGENMYARHSIEYDHLEDYFLVFSIWDDKNRCLSWKDTVHWCEKLLLKHVPILYKGVFDFGVLKKLEKNMNFDKQEGYVVRNADSFYFNEFEYNVAKFVRNNHVQTDPDWKQNSTEINKVKTI